MTNAPTAILWTARLAGIAMSLFLALFALDAFTGRSVADGLADFTIHLAPSLLVLAIVVVAWRYPLAGAGVFALLAVLYAVTAQGRMDWIAVIAGPLLLVALLFFLSWRLAPRGQA